MANFSWERVIVPFPKIDIIRYIVKKNHIGSVISEILRYTETDRHTEIMLLICTKAATPLEVSKGT